MPIVIQLLWVFSVTLETKTTQQVGATLSPHYICAEGSIQIVQLQLLPSHFW